MRFNDFTLKKVSFWKPANLAGLVLLACIFAGHPASAATDVYGTIEQSAFWDAAGGPYVIHGATVKSGVAVVIEAGTSVQFTAGASLYVDGLLEAQGTASAPVSFSGQDGGWGQIQFRSGSVGWLRDCSISGAGASGAAAVLVAGGDVSLQGCSISDNAYHGAQVTSGLLTVESSSFGTNGGDGIQAPAGDLRLYSSSFAGSSDGWHAVAVNGATTFTHANNTVSGARGGIYVWGTLAADATWNVDLPYFVSSLTIPTGHVLTVEPGAVVKFRSPGRIDVAGELRAGAAGAAVTHFTSVRDDAVGGRYLGEGNPSTPAVGDWQAFYFAAGSRGTFNNADIRYGGAGLVPMISVSGSDVTLSGTVVASSQGDCLYVASGSLAVSASSVSTCQYGVRQTGGSVSVSGTSFGSTASDNVQAIGPATLGLEGNAFGPVGSGANAVAVRGDVVFVHSGNTAPEARGDCFMYGSLAADAAWNADLPYVIDSFTVPVGRVLTVEPGAVVKFRSPGRIDVAGELWAGETGGDSVYFTSIRDDAADGRDTNGDGAASAPGSGNWQGLAFAAGSRGDFRNAVVRYGGSNGYLFSVYGDVDYSGSASSSSSEGFVIGAGTLDFSQANLSAMSHAVRQSGGAVSAVNSSFHDNSGDGILVTGGSFSMSGGSAAANAYSGIAVTGGTAQAVGALLTGNNDAFYRSGGSLAASGCSVSGNRNYGARNVSSSAVVMARGNWWGAASGPRHALNPNGTGDRVTDWVDFGDWLDHDPLAQPSLSALGQYGADGTAAIAEGGTTDERSVAFKAAVSSPSGSQVRLQAELLPAGQAFTAEVTGALLESGLVASGSVASVPSGDLADGAYHWRARAVDAEGRASAWQQLGQAGNVDFTLSYVRHITVKVVFVNPVGSESPSGAVTPPCKLGDLANKSYAGRTLEYYNDLASCVTDYFDEQSYEKVSVDFTGLDYFSSTDLPDWQAESHSYAYYGGEEIVDVGGEETVPTFDRLRALGLSFSEGGESDQRQVVIMVHAGTSYQIDKGNHVPPHIVSLTTTAVEAVATNPVVVVLSEDDQVGAWVHELTHVLGLITINKAVPDLYSKPGYTPPHNVGYYDVMSDGAWTSDDTGRDPSSMSTYTKLFLGWLHPNVVPMRTSSFGDGYWTKAVEDAGYGSDALRLNLSDSQAPDAPDYYLIEMRDRGIGNWDNSLREDGPRLILYRKKPSGELVIPGYSRLADFFGISNPLDGVLSVGQTFWDMDNMVSFEARPPLTSVDGVPAINVGIHEINQGTVGRQVVGAVLKTQPMAMPIMPHVWWPSATPWSGAKLASVSSTSGSSAPGSLNLDMPISPITPYGKWFGTYNLLFRNIALCLVVLALMAWAICRYRMSVSDKSPLHKLACATVKVLCVVAGLAALTYVVMLCCGFLYGFKKAEPYTGPSLNNVWLVGMPGGDKLLPTADLHLSCPDGRHVGLNYATGEFDNQVAGSIVSGPMGGAPEWIYVPDAEMNAGCSHYVSSYRVGQYLDAHPEIAARLVDAAEKYDLYARVIDPANGVSTSTVLENQVIEPGQEAAYSIAVAADGTPTVASIPILSALGQYGADGTAAIAEGGTTDERSVAFKAAVSSPSGSQVRLQAELLPAGQAFTAEVTGALLESGLVASGSVASVPSGDLADGAYHWRARAVDAEGRASAWQEFGQEGNVDFVVAYIQRIKVAVVMAEPFGSSHQGGSVTVRPCKLSTTPEKTYENGHDKSYFEDLATCVKDYFLENSYDKVQVDFDFVRADAWHEITYEGKTEGFYAAGNGTMFLLDTIAATGMSQTEDYDILVAIHSGPQREGNLAQMGNMRTEVIIGSGLIKPSIVASEDVSVGALAHEIAHALGLYLSSSQAFTPDLYDIGTVGKWDLMDLGSFNGGSFDVGPVLGDGTNPSSLSTFSRIFLRWLGDDVHVKPERIVGEWLQSIETASSGYKALRYDLGVDSSTNTARYYLLEARNKAPELSDWDTSLPESAVSHLILYYVQADTTTGEPRMVTIPGYNSFADIVAPTLSNNGLLEIGSSFSDYDEMIKVTASDEHYSIDTYEIKADIEPIDAASATVKLRGLVLKAEGWVHARFGRQEYPLAGGGYGGKFVGLAPGYTEYELIGFLRGSFIWLLLWLIPASLVALFIIKRRGKLAKLNNEKIKPVGILVRLLWCTTLVLLTLSFVLTTVRVLLVWMGAPTHYSSEDIRYSPADGVMPPKLMRLPDITYGELPTVDLHLICPDGRHVGVNYETGEFENQVPGSLVSGPMGGASEWIYFSDVSENAGCAPYVSSYREQQWLDAHPDLAAQIPDTSDSYSIYARSIDPATGILTSATLENQAIEPGQEVVHEVSVDETGAPVVEPGVVDDMAPTTEAAVSGSAGTNGWFIGPVSVTLSASDGPGTGVASTEYSTDGGLNWTTYAAPLTVGAEGTTAVLFGSRDHAGNSEATKLLEVRIDSLPPDTLIDSAPAATTNETTANFSFHATEEGSAFSCSLDSAPPEPCASPKEYQNLAPGVHTFSVFAADPAGNPDPTPATWSWTVGGLGTVAVTFQRHAVQSGTNPGSTKAPVSGATVKAFSTASGTCASGIGQNPHDYGLVLSACPADASAVTGAAGQANLDVLPGDYLVLSADPLTSVVAGVASGPVAASQAVGRFLQVIVRADGSSVPAKTTRRTGSLLYVIEPEYVEWDSATELYPFVFDAPDGSWDLTVTVEPPEGFASDYDSLSANVTDDYRALQFTLTDAGSCWECGTGVDIAIRHNGRTEHLTRRIETPMAEAFARRKGLDPRDLEARGVRVMKKVN